MWNIPKVPKKKVFPIPKLISPYEPKKKSARQVRFLSGIASKCTVQEHEIFELAKSEVSAPKVITPVKFKMPTAEDYKHIPKKYVWGKPLLSRAKLMKKPSGIKRIHDWYMWGYKPLYTHGPIWAAPSEVARPTR